MCDSLVSDVSSAPRGARSFPVSLATGSEQGAGASGRTPGFALHLGAASRRPEVNARRRKSRVLLRLLLSRGRAGRIHRTGAIALRLPSFHGLRGLRQAANNFAGVSSASRPRSGIPRPVRPRHRNAFNQVFFHCRRMSSRLQRRFTIRFSWARSRRWAIGAPQVSQTPGAAPSRQEKSPRAGISVGVQSSASHSGLLCPCGSARSRAVCRVVRAQSLGRSAVHCATPQPLWARQRQRGWLRPLSALCSEGRPPRPLTHSAMLLPHACAGFFSCRPRAILVA